MGAYDLPVILVKAKLRKHGDLWPCEVIGSLGDDKVIGVRGEQPGRAISNLSAVLEQKLNCRVIVQL